jgi:hypothetical protein
MKNFYRFCKIQPFDGFVTGSANPGKIAGAQSYSAAVILQLYFIAIYGFDVMRDF